MSDRKPLMPKATAVWLVENTSLAFEQIAEFCGLHNLEVKGIADGDVAQGIKGMDPISSGQLTREQIARAEVDPKFRLKVIDSKVEMPMVKTKRGPRYTPVSRRQDRPNAVLWLLRRSAMIQHHGIAIAGAQPAASTERKVDHLRAGRRRHHRQRAVPAVGVSARDIDLAWASEGSGAVAPGLRLAHAG